MSEPIDAATLAQWSTRANHLRRCAPTSVDDGMAWQGELADYVERLIAEIERRDRAQVVQWNADADMGPLFRKKGMSE